MVADAEGYLGADEEIALNTLALAPETDACKDGELEIVHRAGIGVGRGFDILSPSELGEIELALNGTDDTIIFLARVAHGGSEGQTAMIFLIDGGIERYFVEDIAAAEADSKVPAVFTHLSPHGKSQNEQG